MLERHRFVASSSFLTLIFSLLVFQVSHAAYNVVNYGARPDGKTDSTQAFSKAWSFACNSVKGATVYVPSGSFLVGPIEFQGPCKNRVNFLIDGTIVAPTNYWSFGSSGFWILFYKVTGVTIYGGTVDARGASFWACRLAGKSCPPGARSISFVASSDVAVKKLTSKNSQLFHISIDTSRNILLQGLNLVAPAWSPNTDGVHTQASTGVTISRSVISTGDDCISIGPGSRNFWIERIACGPGHGISIGSLAEHTNEDGVQNVTVAGAVFSGTANGLRIKSWGRPSTGFARDIVFRNIVINNAFNPIIIDQHYCPSGHGCPSQNSGVKISGVTYKTIRGTSASKIAMNFSCSPSNPCQGLSLQNVKLTYLNKGTATSSCSHAHGISRGTVIPTSCF